MHAFVALICAALIAGWLTGGEAGHMVNAIGQVADGFGKTAKGVGIVIALAAIIGLLVPPLSAGNPISNNEQRR